MSNPRQFAQTLVGLVRQNLPLHVPPAQGMVLYTLTDASFGSLQFPYDSHPEITFLSKTSHTIGRDVADMMLEAAPEFRRLTLPPTLYLEGRSHVLRCVNNHLDCMTPEQMVYALAHPLAFSEIGGISGTPKYH